MRYLSLKKKKDFQRILKTGKRVYLSAMTIVYLPSEQTRMAVCVGKKYGKSVRRNRLKRLLREAFRLHADSIARPCDFLLIPKCAETYCFSVFFRDMSVFLKKEKLCCASDL